MPAQSCPCARPVVVPDDFALHSARPLGLVLPARPYVLTAPPRTRRPELAPLASGAAMSHLLSIPVSFLSFLSLLLAASPMLDLPL